MSATKYTIKALFDGPRSVGPHVGTQVVLCFFPTHGHNTTAAAAS